MMYGIRTEESITDHISDTRTLISACISDIIGSEIGTERAGLPFRETNWNTFIMLFPKRIFDNGNTLVKQM